MASRKRFQKVKSAHFNGRNGAETLRCDVTVVLNIAAFLRQCVVLGKGFGSKFKPYFTSGEGLGVCPLFGGHYSLVFLCFFVQLPACNFP